MRLTGNQCESLLWIIYIIIYTKWSLRRNMEVFFFFLQELAFKSSFKEPAGFKFVRGTVAMGCPGRGEL